MQFARFGGLFYMSLTPKQSRFVDEYLIDLNASQAAIRAGYSTNRANAMGYENLTKPDIAQAIEAAMKARSERTEVTQDRVLAEFAKLAFLDPRRFYDANGGLKPVHLLDADVAAALVGVDVVDSFDSESQSVITTKKIKFVDKKGALDSCARHLGMFKDKLEHSGEIKNPELRLVLNGVKPTPPAN